MSVRDKKEIFISYSSIDSDAAANLCGLLENDGISYWIDRHHINHGDWAEYIPPAIEACNIFVCLLSQNSIASEMVGKELSLAVEKKKRILGIKIQDVTLSRKFDFHFAGEHLPPAYESDGKTRFRHARASILQMLGKSVDTKLEDKIFKYSGKVITATKDYEFDNFFTPLYGKERLDINFENSHSELGGGGYWDFDDNQVDVDTNIDENAQDIDDSTSYDQSRVVRNENLIDLLESGTQSVVLLGESGSGKSWCLKYLWRRWASAKREDGRVLLYAQLGKFNNSIFKLFETEFSEDEIRTLSRNGRLHLLLDGLNECQSDFLREKCKAHLQSIQCDYPLLRIILTTREYDGFLGVPLFNVSPMERDAQRNFIGRYIDSEDKASKLLNLLGNFEIAANPLSLSLIVNDFKKSEQLTLIQANSYRQLFVSWYETKAKKSRVAKSSFPWNEDEFLETIAHIAFKSRLEGSKGRSELHVINDISGNKSRYLIEWLGQGLLFKIRQSSNDLETHSDAFDFVHEAMQECSAAMYLVSHPEAWAMIPREHARDWDNVAFHAISLQHGFPDEGMLSPPPLAMRVKIAEINPWILGRYTLSNDENSQYALRTDGSFHPCLRAWLFKTRTPSLLPIGLFEEWSSGFAFLLESDKQLRNKWVAYCENLFLNLEARPLLVLSKHLQLNNKALTLGLTKPLSMKLQERLITKSDFNALGEARYLASLCNQGYITKEVILDFLFNGRQLTIFQASQLVSGGQITWVDIPANLRHEWAANADFEQAAFWILAGAMTWADFASKKASWIEQATVEQAARWVGVGVLKWEDFSNRDSLWLERAAPKQAEKFDLRAAWIAKADISLALDWIEAGRMTIEDFKDRRAEWIESASPEDVVRLVEADLMAWDDFSDRHAEWIESASPKDVVRFVEANLIAWNEFSGQRAKWAAHAKPNEAAELVDAGLMAKVDFADRRSEWMETSKPGEAARLVKSRLMSKVDFVNLRTEWIENASPQGCAMLVESGVMEREDFVNRRATWIENALPDQAAVLVNAGIMKWDDFSDLRQMWIKDFKVKEVTRLLSAGYPPSDFAGRRAEWIEKSKLNQAAILVEYGLLNWDDFADRRAEWIMSATPAQAAILVEANVLDWNAFEVQAARNKKMMLVGAVVKGVVTRLTDYGVFVELGGGSGLIHKSEMGSLAQYDHPSAALTIGEIIDVRIIGYEKTKQQRFSLSMRVPFSYHLDRIAEGNVVKGIVKNITTYGAFVDMGGIDGLVHITDLAWRRVKHPSEVVTVGDEIEAKILKIDHGMNRVSLGIKQLDDPWKGLAQRYPKGSILFGTVAKLTDFGAFVEIALGVNGLVHVSEMDGASKKTHPSKVVKIGDKVEVMVLEIDEIGQRISLSMKQCPSKPR